MSNLQATRRCATLLAVAVVLWTVADVIVKLRKQKKWGRKKLAKRARLAYMTIARMEQGKEMKDASIRAVASAFGITQGDLFALVPTSPVLTARERELLNIWRGLPDEAAQENVLRIAQTAYPIDQEQELTQRPEHQAKAPQSDREKKGA